jgi:hypothetical protein
MPFLSGPIGGNWTFVKHHFITEWIALKHIILSDIKIRFKKKILFHNRPCSFCSMNPNVCDRTKKMDYWLPFWE